MSDHQDDDRTQAERDARLARTKPYRDAARQAAANAARKRKLHANQEQETNA